MERLAATAGLDAEGKAMVARFCDHPALAEIDATTDYAPDRGDDSPFFTRYDSEEEPDNRD